MPSDVFMPELLTQTATYWAPAGRSGYGTTTFAAPVAIACAWYDRADLIVDKEGKQAASRAMVVVDRDMDLNGYLALGDQTAPPTAMTGEAMGLVAGKIYRVLDAAKRMLDDSETITVWDGATDVTAQVLSYEYALGQVTFHAAYTVVGAVTMDATYIPVTADPFQAVGAHELRRYDKTPGIEAEVWVRIAYL